MADRRVLFYGDSFVAGAGDPDARGWVGRVAAAAGPLTAYNLGVRGETSVQVAGRWQAEAWPRLRAQARFGVVFSVGANDACPRDGVDDGPPRVELATTAGTVGELLDAAALMNLPAFVVGPPPVGEPAPDARILELTGALARVCASRGIPFVGVAGALLADAGWTAEAAAGDGAHPAARGYDRLAELVLAGGFSRWLDRL